MKRKYIYCFSLGGSKIVWSGETENTLKLRADNDEDLKTIKEFIKVNEVGHFCSLSTGEIVFQVSK